MEEQKNGVILKESEILTLCQQIDDVIESSAGGGFIRFSWSDLHGVSRGISVPAANAQEFLRGGFSAFAGAIAFGPQAEIYKDIFETLLKEHGVENCNYIPAIPRLYSMSWLNQSDKQKTMELICEALWDNGEPFTSMPRYLARKQTCALKELGYTFMCAFESEFLVLNADTLEPAFNERDYLSNTRVTEDIPWLYELDKHLRPNGVNIRSFHSEYSEGQMEVTFMPQESMLALDNMFIYKQAIKDIAKKHGKVVTFMTKAYPDGLSNGYHFNHSLVDSDKKNVLWDTSKPDNLSQIGRYWIGGTLKHLNAITALSCPTVNCYRRLHTPISPYRANWSIDIRHMTVRVVNKNEASMRVENRLPSSACNPYLVLAGVVAAGLDGIKNKIEPPPPGLNEDGKSLPHSLEEALTSLEQDDVMREALGAEFISMFTALKRNTEIEQLKNHDMKKHISEEMAAERKEYLKRS